MKRITAEIQERAGLIAEKILGTQVVLDSFLEENEMNDEDLLNAIFDKVNCCYYCGTWVEVEEIDRYCTDCYMAGNVDY